MKVSDIEPGARYRVRLSVPAPYGKQLRVTRAGVVIDKRGAREIVVEITEPVCVNLDDYPPAQHGWAMVNQYLRWEFRPVQRTLRATDFLHPAPGPGADVVDAAADQPGRPGGAVVEAAAAPGAGQ